MRKPPAVRAHSSAERSHLLLELEIIQIAVKKVSGFNQLELGWAEILHEELGHLEFGLTVEDCLMPISQNLKVRDQRTESIS